jgi:hypothetical protein
VSDLGVPPTQSELGVLMTMLQPIIGQIGQGFPAQFFPQQPIFDQMRQMEMQRQVQASMGASAATAQANFAQVLHGAANLAGYSANHPYHDVIAHDAGQIYQYAAPFMPRGLRSALWGGRGDPTLAGEDFYRAGQSKFDPVTGGLGYQASSAFAAANQIYGGMADNPAYRGVKVDELSQFLGMQMHNFQGVRGALGNAEIAQIQRGESLSSGSLGRLTSSDRAVLGRGDIGADDKLRGMESGRMESWATEQADVLRSLKDLFGPNAPIPQLFQAMKDLTQNNVQGLNATQMADTLRQTKELANMSGMGVSGLAAIQGFLGSYAQSQGMNARGVPQAALGSAAYSTAFTALGYGAANGLSKDKLSAMHGQLQVNAGNSAAAGQLGATLSVAEAVGGFAPGSEAEQLISAMKNGQSTYGPSNKSVFMNESEWRRVMKSGGADENLIRETRLQTDVNKRKAVDAGLDATLRQIQFSNDLAPRMRQQIGNSLTSMLGKGAGAAADVAIKSIMDMDVTKFTNDPEGAINTVVASLRAAGVAGDDNQLRKIAALSIGGFETVAAARGYGADGSNAAANVKGLFDPKILAATRTEKTRAGLRGEMAKAFSGIGDDSIWTRLVDTVMKGKPGTSMMDVVKSIFNIVPNEEMGKLLGEAFQPLDESRKKIDSILSDPRYVNKETRQMTEEGRRLIDVEKEQLRKALPGAQEAYRKAMEAGGHPAATPADGSKPLVAAPTELTLHGTITIDGEDMTLGGTGSLGGALNT